MFFLLVCIGIDVYFLTSSTYELTTTGKVISYGITGLAALHACGSYGKREKLRENRFAGAARRPDLEMGASKYPAAAQGWAAGQAAPVAAPVVAAPAVAVAVPVVAVAAPVVAVAAPTAI